jgi:hypothetical protein
VEQKHVTARPIFTPITIESFSPNGECFCLDIVKALQPMKTLTLALFVFLQYLSHLTFVTGVNVCQYALSMFNLHFLFTYEHVYVSTPPLSVITNSLPFPFDQDTIVPLRSTMKKLLQTLLQVYHRVEVITDSPNKIISTAAAGSANVFKAGTVSNDNFFCKPASSGNGPPLELQYHLSQKSDQQGLSQESA